MPNYKVTLTQKEKTDVEAATPEDAVRKAQENFKELEFTPTAWAVKEVETEE